MSDMVLTHCPVCLYSIEECICGTAVKQEPIPKGIGKPIQDLVIKDILERKEFGIKKYGEALKAFNGRNALIDAYQETLDLLMYLKQLIIEDEWNKTLEKNSSKEM